MKRFVFIPILVIVIAAYALFSCKKKVSPEKAIAQTLSAQVDSFTVAKNKLLDAVKGGKADEKQLQALFIDARIAYKKFEWAAEYFSPAASRFINGPPVQEVEMSDGQVFEPAGLQVIEMYLFPKYDLGQKKELINQLQLLDRGTKNYKTYFDNIDIFNWQVFDAAKLQVFRVQTLGITGFDDPLSLKAMDESAASLEPLKAVMAYYETDGDKITGQLNSAISYLKNNHTNFNAFNRAAFITQYSNGIAIGISNLEQKLNIHIMRYNRLLNQDAKTLFDKNAFNVNAYKPYEDADVNDKKVALGRVLFSDPILSGTGTRSCQSCHQPEKAFTDGMVKNTIINSTRLVRRNTPTLLNAALQPAQFYDLRVGSLEDQSNAVVGNVQEMHGSMKLAVNKLWQNKSYRELFSNTFPQKNRKSIDTMEVMNALSSYVRSLSMLNSRFDEYMRGNKTAMTAQEVNGFNLFMGKAKCGTCHYMPLFNGTFPPRYIKIESEVIGVPQSRTLKVIDADMGRYDIMKVNAFKHAFKTMTVRNAARTAPYMHNGVFTTLEQVVDFYNKGGGVGMGIKIDNQTLPFDKLDLTAQESSDVVAFIKTLDSK
ncbi:MAG TPA: cytochrome c peroxidase [Mucilaginibacter sp.]|jgi:cytochrome c peroxidase|nr:cytochrome c peroxidase [Mucilaginibacter sp.]